MSKLNNSQFGYSLSHSEGKYLHQVTARTTDGDFVGTMDWNKRSGRVFDIQVHPDHRRQGLASHMWDLAQQVSKEARTPAPQHSPERTPDGDAWAKAVGGKLPAVKICTACGEVGHLANENLC